ncbi:outer membrane protein transport protein [Microbulbifer agarilyticus]|uniref:OmpP1/FadL family transporter n=1 Tax=Microbulbifer agarilyticus TaxID=260552 RepID=UPI001C94883F|nr:outer membrane protein transport protein [Microbulbifer agarilyticus]MBY6191306.1 outer membrane protein transport protein [Microbulbifer agarilyticus]MBY6212783.1 outer membrane protein transport protein [Microbulbifer agarilyticus]
MNTKTLRKAALAAAICSVTAGTYSSGAFAAGFALQESSTSGLGRAFAAENAIGDNAAILARNPAGSALFNEMAFSVGVTYVNPEIDAAGQTDYYLLTQQGPVLAASVFDKADDYASSAFVPNAYLAIPLDDCWSFGIAMNTDYGLETDFNSSWPVTHIADKTELLSVTIAPSVAFDFADQFSIGLSANFLYGDATLKTKVPNNFVLEDAAEQLLGFPVSNAKILDADGDDWYVGWSIGGLWRSKDGHTHVGVSYQSELRPEIDADVNSDLLPSFVDGRPFDNERARLTLDLPDTLEIGVYHRFDEHWGIAMGALWTDWDDFERLQAFFPDQRVNDELVDRYNPLLIKEENFQSGWRYSLGAEYYPCEEITWRVGYAYDNGAARDGLNEDGRIESAAVGLNGGLGLPVTWRTLSIPDADRQWVTFGGTYKFNDQLSVDGGLAYIWGDDEPIQEFQALPLTPDIGLGTYFNGGTTNLEAWLVGASLNYSF